MMDRIDDLDLQIIRELKANSRQSYREIAEKLKVAEGTVYNRVNRLLEMNVIKRFIVDVDYSKIGYDLCAVIGIVVEGGYLPEVEKRLSKESNVSAVYDVTGEYDAILIAKFKDRQSLNDLVKRVHKIPNVKRTYTMIVLNVVKEEHGIEV